MVDEGPTTAPGGSVIMPASAGHLTNHLHHGMYLPEFLIFLPLAMGWDPVGIFEIHRFKFNFGSAKTRYCVFFVVTFFSY